MSNESVANDISIALPAIFVTPPSPPTSVTSIGSCGDLLLVEDEIGDESTEKDTGNYRSYHGSVDSSSDGRAVYGGAQNGTSNEHVHENGHSHDSALTEDCDSMKNLENSESTSIVSAEKCNEDCSVSFKNLKTDATSPLKGEKDSLIDSFRVNTVEGQSETKHGSGSQVLHSTSNRSQENTESSNNMMSLVVSQDKNSPSASRGDPGGNMVVPSASRGDVGGNMVVPSASTGDVGGNMVVPSASRGDPGGNMVVPSASRGDVGGNMVVPSASTGDVGGNMVVPSASIDDQGGNMVVPSTSRGDIESNRVVCNDQCSVNIRKDKDTQHTERHKDCPAIVICDDIEPRTNPKSEFSLKIDLASPGHGHRPDFTDVFPVDEIPMADPPVSESSFDSGNSFNFLHATTSSTNSHFLSPNSSHHYRTGIPCSSQNAQHHPPKHHLHHLQHLLRGNGHHHHHNNYHHQQRVPHRNHYQLHHLGGSDEDNRGDVIHQSSTQTSTSISKNHPIHHNERVSALPSPSISPAKTHVETKPLNSSQERLDLNDCVKSKPAVKLEVQVVSKSSEYLEDDDDFSLEQCSPRPRLSSMEPGTRKTDFKFRRPKKLQTP